MPATAATTTLTLGDPVTIAEALKLSRFHLVSLAFQRAKQIQAGARPRVDAAGHKPTRVALLEVMADTISWTVEDKVERPPNSRPA
jgi:DNA-directed RNA polymerase omega subunit